MKIDSLSISSDINGNKILRIKPQGARGFSIQTNGNLPVTHRYGVCGATLDEAITWLTFYGTPAQRLAIKPE
jgi:hypothetical protein